MRTCISGIASFIAFPQQEGDPVPSAATVTIKDENGAQVSEPFSALDTWPTVDLSAAVLTLPADAVRGYRGITVILETDQGEVTYLEEVIVERAEILAINENSFQTYPQALLISFDIPSLPGWTAASKTQRIPALVQARRNIAALRFRYYFENEQDFIESSTFIRDLTQLSMSEWQALPDDFREALCRAQVIEADFLLGGDPIHELRRLGIISKTVGESKALFKQNNTPLDGPVCTRTLKELAKYRLARTRIGRTA